jgi:hypothetical protein
MEEWGKRYMLIKLNVVDATLYEAFDKEDIANDVFLLSGEEKSLSKLKRKQNIKFRVTLISPLAVKLSDGRDLKTVDGCVSIYPNIRDEYGMKDIGNFFICKQY